MLSMAKTISANFIACKGKLNAQYENMLNSGVSKIYFLFDDTATKAIAPNTFCTANSPIFE